MQKINSSNTWSFALIDYFHDMSLLRNADDPGSINFQKASVTLDGCVKIWTSRVDSVATETGKLLNGLSGDAGDQAWPALEVNNDWSCANLGGSAAGAQEQDDEENSTNEAGDEENGGEGRPKKKRTRNANATTLADSFSKIQVKDLELEFTVDPLFKKTSADFDEGGAAGLLMNHLGCDSTMRVVFDAGDAKVEESDADEEQESGKACEEKVFVVDILKLKGALRSPRIPCVARADVGVACPLANPAKFLPDLDALADMAICPSLSAFKFSADPTLLDMSLFNRTHLEASTSSSSHNFDVAKGVQGGIDGPMNVLDDLTYSNAAIAGGTQDFFDDPGNYDDQGNDDGMGGAGFDMGGGGSLDGFSGEEDHPSDSEEAGNANLGAMQRFDPRVAENQREVVIGMGGSEEGDKKVFSYFDNALSKNWAGPEHWKMRRTIRRTRLDKEEEDAAASNRIAGPKSKRAPKEAFHIEFSPDVEAPSSKQLFGTSNASITLPSAKRKRGAVQEKREDYLLPDDMHFSSQQLLTLFLKPKATVTVYTYLKSAAKLTLEALA